MDDYTKIKKMSRHRAAKEWVKLNDGKLNFTNDDVDIIAMLYDYRRHYWGKSVRNNVVAFDLQHSSSYRHRVLGRVMYYGGVVVNGDDDNIQVGFMTDPKNFTVHVLDAAPKNYWTPATIPTCAARHDAATDAYEQKLSTLP